MSDFTTWKAIKDDLGYMSRARTVKHLLTDNNKADRVAKNKKNINAMETKRSYLIFGPPTRPTSTHVISTYGATSRVRPASYTTPPS